LSSKQKLMSAKNIEINIEYFTHFINSKFYSTSL